MSSFLDNVPEEVCFRLGSRGIYSLVQLRDALRDMPDEEFRSYVGDGYNHFANWIRDVVKDTALADALAGKKAKEDVYAAIESRINELREPGHHVQHEADAEEKHEHRHHEHEAEQAKPSHEDVIKRIQNIKDELTKGRPEGAGSKADARHGSSPPAAGQTVSGIAWQLGREFWYGIAIGIIIGALVSRMIR